MNDIPANSTLMLDLLEHWEESYRLGRDPTPGELCPDRPDLHVMIGQRIERRKKLLKMLESTKPGDDRQRPDGLPSLPGYQLTREIGRGGMGVVYLGEQLGLGRAVAIKMLSGMGSPGRFRAEAQALASLRHSNIVQVFEVGEHQGAPFLVLELLDGSMADVLRDGPLPAEECAALLGRLARAVAGSHEAGILHRDLKPGNVLLGRGDDASACLVRGRSCVPKVADFGLAKHFLDTPETDAATTGGPVGTPSYMAPEQFQHPTRDVGPGVDIWALGAILYECLTGRPPFQAPDFFTACELVNTEDPVPPKRLNPKVPKDLETICLKCLRKNPSDRYPSAMAFAEDLARYRDGQPIRARRVPPWMVAWKWVQRHPAATALGLLTVAAVVTALIVSWVYNAQLRASREQERRQRSRAELALGVARDLSDRFATDTMNQFRAGDQTRIPKKTLTQMDETIRAYQQIAQLLPEDPKTWETLSRLWFFRSRHDETASSHAKALAASQRALALREAELLDHPNNEEFIALVANRSFHLGRTLASRGEADKAEPLILRNAELKAELAHRHPENRKARLAAANARFEVAHFLYHLRSDAAGALRWVRPGLKEWEAALSSTNPPTKGRHEYYDAKADEAQALEDLGQLKAAQNSWEVVLKDRTLPPRLRAKYSLKRGDVAAQLGDSAQAIQDIRLASKWTAKFPELWIYQAVTHAYVAQALQRKSVHPKVEWTKQVSEHRSLAEDCLRQALEHHDRLTQTGWDKVKQYPVFDQITVPPWNR